jgi:hypothetical protein
MRENPLDRVRLREEVAHDLNQDLNFWLLGVPGSGRKRFIEGAVQDIKGIVLYLDCLRATDKARFVSLLAQSFLAGYGAHTDGLAWVSRHLSHHRVQIDPRTCQLSLWVTQTRTLEQDFLKLLELPQIIAERRQQRVVVFLNNFVHLTTWDREERWQQQIRAELDRLPDANYILGYGVSSGPNLTEAKERNFKVVKLMPLAADPMARWFQEQFQLTEGALEYLLTLAAGHVGTALALARRLNSENCLDESTIEQVASELLQDQAATFETLLRQLPAIQARVLETLALDPTPHPQSNDYTQAHGLPRGGSLQGALTALVKKDLLYGPDSLSADGTNLAYHFCQPFLGRWVQQYFS